MTLVPWMTNTWVRETVTTSSSWMASKKKITLLDLVGKEGHFCPQQMAHQFFRGSPPRTRLYLTFHSLDSLANLVVPSYCSFPFTVYLYSFFIQTALSSSRKPVLVTCTHLCLTLKGGCPSALMHSVCTAGTLCFNESDTVQLREYWKASLASPLNSMVHQETT